MNHSLFSVHSFLSSSFIQLLFSSAKTRCKSLRKKKSLLRQSRAQSSITILNVLKGKEGSGAGWEGRGGEMLGRMLNPYGIVSSARAMDRDSIPISAFRRKWLPPPLRKLSQSKVDKSSERPPPPPPLPPPASAKKSGLDKLFKLPSSGSSDKSQASSSGAPASRAAPAAPASRQGSAEEEVAGVGPEDAEDARPLSQQNGAEDAEDEQLELPPPMKPITEPILVAGASATPSSANSDDLPGKLVR
jgi:hypothetical protein